MHTYTYVEVHINTYVYMCIRTRFISACINEKLNPRASLVTRKHMTRKMELSHLGIGDKLAGMQFPLGDGFEMYTCMYISMYTCM